MGSFYARWYAEKWPESITALVISGTAGPSFMNVVGQRLAGLIARVQGAALCLAADGQAELRQLLQENRERDSLPNAWLSRDKSCCESL